MIKRIYKIMKKLLKPILLAVLLSGIANGNALWPEAMDAEMAGKVGTLTSNHADYVMNYLESAPWIEVGSQQGKGKYLYVLYTPNSVDSQALYQHLKPYVDQVNVRWIPIIAGGLNVDGLYEKRTPETLARLFDESLMAIAQGSEALKRLSSMTFTGFIYLRSLNAFSPESQSYFPTVLYGDSHQVMVDILPDVESLDQLIAQIPVTMPNTNQPNMAELAQVAHQIYPVKSTMRYMNDSNQANPVYLSPSEDSVQVNTFRYDRNSYLISGITDNGYIAMDINGQGNYLYIKYIQNQKIELKPAH